jgi:formylglycine-generating enzyme required for sulfatase activity
MSDKDQDKNFQSNNEISNTATIMSTSQDSMNEVIENVKAIQTNKNKVTKFLLEWTAGFFIRYCIHPFVFTFSNKKVVAILGIVTLLVCLIIFAGIQNRNAPKDDDSTDLAVSVEEKIPAQPSDSTAEVPTNNSSTDTLRNSSDSSVTINIKSGKTAGERMTLKISNVEYAFRWCPAGSFMMGSPESEEERWENETQHRVTLSNGFWMQETEITQEQWESITGNNPSKFKGSPLPVERVSWIDCQGYVSKLNNVVSSGYKFSLPTEAQWEYACRAGTSTPFNFGSVLNGNKANCAGNYPYGTGTKGKYWEMTTTVGSYSANGWGVYDMHGNVWEWCRDWYGDYPSGNVTDPTGVNNGSHRVSRGGSWCSNARSCRSTYRNYYMPTFRDSNLGCRLVLISEK